jgi:Subtilase family
MCTFVPGEAIAIGPIQTLHDLGEVVPGLKSTVRPLLSEVGDYPANSDLARLGTLTVRIEPGLELFALSRISARLAGAIEKHEAAVDLNHILPLSAAVEPAGLPLRLSPHAAREVDSIRRVLRSLLLPTVMPRRIAVLDSGLSPSYLAHRNVRYLDYSAAGHLRLDSPQSDPLGHGTRVVTILDQVLPPDAELSVGRLPSEASSLTTLNLAHALGDIVARERPEVVNLSVSLQSAKYVCPACKQRVSAPTFLSSFFPLIIRLSGRSAQNTITVIAAGNTGQVPSSRWLTDDVSTLLFAVAEDRNGDRAQYSSAPEGPSADLVSAGAFGGDDPATAEAQGVFLDGAHGTSFAAPFVSASALLAKQYLARATQDLPVSIGTLTRDVIEAARNGRIPQLAQDDHGATRSNPATVPGQQPRASAATFKRLTEARKAPDTGN